jgi:hypothetical protein
MRPARRTAALLQRSDFGEHDFVVLPRVGETIELDGYGHVPVVSILHCGFQRRRPPIPI